MTGSWQGSTHRRASRCLVILYCQPNAAECDCSYGVLDYGFGAQLQYGDQSGANVSLDWVHGVGGYEQPPRALEA